MTSENNSAGRATITRASVPVAQRPWLDRYSSWQRFHRGVRRRRLPLLKNLPRYPRCVLVAGCQRSGTTMLTRLIAGATGFARLSLTKDDELDAALVLAGFIDLSLEHRYCFQTTYLNECFLDYRQLTADQRLIWVVRNPYSVVYSMLHNWRRFALNELYEGCGIEEASSTRLRRGRMPWPLGPSRIEKACLAYRGKVAQILAIKEFLHPQQLLVIDYDTLIESPTEWLPQIFRFAAAPFDVALARSVHDSSASKADRLSLRDRKQIEQLTGSIYRECVALAQDNQPAVSGR